MAHGRRFRGQTPPEFTTAAGSPESLRAALRHEAHHHHPGRGFGRGEGDGPGEPGFGPSRGFAAQFGPGGFGGPGGRGPGGRGPGWFGPGLDPLFGPGFGPHHRGRGGRRGGRAGRGDVRAAVLLLLKEGPQHGYQLIKEIAERSEGRWRPSPGAIYPALSLLQDEGLVELSSEGGRRLASLTDAGRAYVEEHAEELGDPWADAVERDPGPDAGLRDATMTALGAVQQVARTGTQAQVAAAITLLEATRRELYLILAGEATPGASGDAPRDTPQDTPDDGAGPGLDPES